MEEETQGALLLLFWWLFITSKYVQRVQRNWPALRVACACNLKPTDNCNCNCMRNSSAQFVRNYKV